MNKKERFEKVIAYFEEHQPVAETELVYKDVYELTVAVILSAQCTDKRVNMITPGFFRQYPDIEALSNGSVESVFELVKSCSYPNNKSKNLVKMANTVINDYDGNIPSTVEELMKIPGIGRKTANVIAAVAYNQPAMPVDTHVFRVSARIGLSSNAKTPFETEKQLVRYIPKDKLSIAHHWLILHGRYVCQARKPKCHECGITKFCKYFEKR